MPVRCSNMQCPEFDKYQRPLDKDQDNSHLSAKFNYDSEIDKANGVSCFKPIKKEINNKSWQQIFIMLDLVKLTIYRRENGIRGIY